jgi:long-subunit acyl-CoA synthetase (AMP-forming)
MSNHCVPLYDSLGENAIEYIVDHAECTCVFLSSDKFPQFVKASAIFLLAVRKVQTHLSLETSQSLNNFDLCIQTQGRAI